MKLKTIDPLPSAPAKIVFGRGTEPCVERNPFTKKTCSNIKPQGQWACDRCSFFKNKKRKEEHTSAFNRLDCGMLSTETVANVKAAFEGIGKSPDEVLVTLNRYSMTAKNIECLRDDHWLNDEVINFMVERLKERDRRLVDDCLRKTKSIIFNSFFYFVLADRDVSYNYEAVTRWTRATHKPYLLTDKVDGDGKFMEYFDIFALDKVIIPINVINLHWFCMGMCE